MRKPMLGLALFLTPLACVGPQGGPGEPADPCADFEVEVERTWSASIKAEVMKHGGEIELEQRQAVVNKMDRISEDWVRMRTSVCKDHFVRQLIDKDEYAARVRCFDDRLNRQRTLAETLSGGAAAGEVEAAIDELIAQPASCEQEVAP
ncbi:hypothetical protein ACNOYE_09395 [Nannocystaceae bacterium ST9]